MKKSQDANLAVQDIPYLLSKYRAALIGGALAGVLLFLAAAFLLPPKYKVNFVLTIDPRFFQSPLVGEFLPGLGSSGDLKSQGESLLRQSLTPEFLDVLGRKYEVYSMFHTPSANPTALQRFRGEIKTVLLRYGLLPEPSNAAYLLARERQDLLMHIEIFNAYQTTYSVGYISSNPETAYHLAQDLYDQMVRTLPDMRSRNMVDVRDAIARRLDSLVGNLGSVPSASAPPPPALTKRAALQDQLEQVRAQIHVLASQYTDEHPAMQELRKKESFLVTRLRSADSGAESAGLVGKTAAEGDANREVFNDLTRKLNYLNIAIDSDRQQQANYFALIQPPLYPAAPIWPKKPLMVIWGLALGLFCSLFYAAIREYFDRSALRAETLAQHMDLPLVGSLPAFAWKASGGPALLEAPRKK